MTKCTLLLAASRLLVLAALAEAMPAAPAELGTALGRPASIDKPGAATGVVEGVVRYRADSKRAWPLSRYYIKNPNEGLLAECVVALEGSALAGIQPAYTPKSHTMDQVNFQFVPETMLIRAGDSVDITNSDDALHNVMTPDGGSPFNLNVARGQQLSRSFDHAGGLKEPVHLTCVFHGQMRAWIYVFDHPWFQLTERDGRFRFENVPAGRYNLGVVHPAGKLRWNREIEVQPAGKTQVEITLSPDDLIGRKTKVTEQTSTSL